MNKAILSVAVTHILLNLIMVTITRQVFINIIQMEYFSVVKFDKNYEKKYELSCDTKILKSWEKIVKIRLSSFRDKSSVAL